jgi:hypothetical protein
MKIQKKHKHTSKIMMLALTAILLLMIGYGLLSYKVKLWPFTKSQFNAATEEQKTAGQDIKKRSLDNPNKSDKEKKQSSSETKTTQGSDPSPKPTPSSNGGKPTVSVSITATTTDKTANILYIRSLIQTVSSSGKCTLSMNNDSGSVYSSSAESQPGPSTSSCKGFNIPLSKLSPGKWKIAIHYEDDSVTGNTEGEVNI